MGSIFTWGGKDAAKGEFRTENLQISPHLSDSASEFIEREGLVAKYFYEGKPKHNARIVAAMRVDSISTVLTFNDFRVRRHCLMHGLTACYPSKMNVEQAAPSSPDRDFDVQALYAALDQERQQRGLTWRAVTDEINRTPTGQRRLSASTVAKIRDKRFLEGDGVLQMLLWLKRTPESFCASIDGDGALLPEVGPGQVLRWDLAKMYGAFDERRAERGMTWDQVAAEIGCSPNSLTNLSKNSRTGFPGVMRLVRWLERPAAEFTRLSER